LRKLLKGDFKGVLVRRPEHPRANRNNLAAKYFRQMEAEFDGSDLLAQELDDQEIATSAPFEGIDFGLLRSPRPSRNDLKAVAIGVDPARTAGASSCEIGIVGGGIDARDHLYALEDASGLMSPTEWPGRVLDLAARLEANYLVVEVNVGGGGQLGPELIRQEERLRRARAGKPAVSTIEICQVRSDKSKAKRATALRPLYVAGQVHHCDGLQQLERQLRELDDTEGRRNDRADAWVHVARALAGVGDDAATDPSEQLVGLAERVQVAQQQQQARASAMGLRTFPGLPGWDPRSTNYARASSGGLSRKRVL